MTAATLEKHDSAKFKETVFSDPTVPFESEGGWSITRAQYTRHPPRVFYLGFTDMSDADKQAIMQLYEDMRGAAGIITGWHHPVSGVEIPVRFKQGSIPSCEYKGFGTNYRWNISDVVLEEV